jgi:dTDP-4-dehydrorhamnose reductase
MRVVVTGTGGRLGAAVARHLRERHRVVAYDRRALDLREPAQIEDHLGGLEFDALINCAAVTSLDYCETHPGEAAAVNTGAPALMARICRERGAHMIHLSTNYVYDGPVAGLRCEEDPVNPLGVYARTKLEGERAVLATDGGNIVARTAWIFGPDRSSFADQIISRAQKEMHCTVISDTFSSASYSLDMASLLERLMSPDVPGGIYNLSNDGSCSWLELGQAALDIVSDLGWKLRCRTLTPCGISEMKSFLAPRPRHTVMSLTRLTAATGIPVRPWREALEDYLRTYYSGPG